MKNTLIGSTLVAIAILFYISSEDNLLDKHYIGDPPQPTIEKELYTNLPEYKPLFNQEDLHCLTQNIFFEARNQTAKGMIAVASVTMNRVEHTRYPDTVCGVIKQARYRNGKMVLNKCQFSWYCDGKSEKVNFKIKGERLAWMDAKFIAEGILSKIIPRNVGDSTHYHAVYVSPYWIRSKRMIFMAKVDDHKFYKELAP